MLIIGSSSTGTGAGNKNEKDDDTNIMLKRDKSTISTSNGIADKKTNKIGMQYVYFNYILLHW